MLRYVALILLILLIALQVKLWVGQGGMAEVWRLEKTVAAQKLENDVLRARNDALIETFYQVVEPSATTQSDDDDEN